MRRASLLILLAGLAATVPALAKKKEPLPYRPTTPTIFALPLSLAIAGFDADGDTRVTRAEYDAGVIREWTRADTDGDGTLGAIEHGAWAERTLGSPGALPSLLDLDHDGDDRISREEFTRFFAQRFAALDKDKDGVLTRGELISLRVDPSMLGKPGAPGVPPGGQGGAVPPQGPPPRQ
ncbi:hypothetical protein FHS96_002489 [Sphingomonas zeicaulis]|uniref:EF-hand domain-containing protein n=1 Tax=Sphingomonas zeicaulis TaxID=1632740 RepID=UPI003D246BA3